MPVNQAIIGWALTGGLEPGAGGLSNLALRTSSEPAAFDPWSALSAFGLVPPLLRRAGTGQCPAPPSASTHAPHHFQPACLFGARRTPALVLCFRQTWIEA